MDGQPAAPVSVPRLNPFAFPSDTDFRFALLVASVVGASLFFFNGLFWAVPSLRADGLADFQACMPRLATTQAALIDVLSGARADPSGLAAAATDFQSCLAPGNRLRAAWTAGGTLLALSVATALYWLAPPWVVRRKRLVPLPNDLPGVGPALAELCREAGLARPPTLLWDPLDGSPTGLAFGRLGRYYLALTGGLVMQLYQNPATFRAVVRHELAHLRNADVDKTYFAIAVALAFALTAALPYLVTVAVGPPDWSYLFQLGWRGLALAGLVYATLAAVLRAREVYADVRASLSDGPSGALGRVLATLPEGPTSRWRRALAFHPSPSARRRALESTDHLLRLGFWEPFAAGVAAALALPNVEAMLSFVPVGPQQVLTGLALAPLVGGVVGLGVWRAVFAALARHRPLPSTADLALGLASGVVVGRVLSFDVAVAPLQASRSATLITFDLLCVGLLFAGVFLLLGWISDGALSWLASGAAGRSLRLAYAANLAIAGGLLAAGLGQLLVLHGMVEGVLGGSSGFDPAALAGVVGLFVGGGLLLIVSSPFTMAALASLWAFPLAAAWLPTSPGGRDGGWAYLDAAPSAVVSTAPSPFRVAEAVRRGLRGGLVFGVLLLALRLTVRLLVPEEVGLTDPQKLALYAAMIALAWLVQAFVAWRATKRIEWLGVAHGLLAGFVAGCVAAVGILGINLVFGGSIDLAWIWQVVGPTVAGGGVLALPAALVAAATGRSRGRLIAVPEGART